MKTRNKVFCPHESGDCLRPVLTCPQENAETIFFHSCSMTISAVKLSHKPLVRPDRTQICEVFVPFVIQLVLSLAVSCYKVRFTLQG